MIGPTVESEMLREARDEVGYADHKASLVLTALGIGFSALAGGLIAGDWSPSDQGRGEATWWVGVVLAIGSIVLAAAAVWPRTTAYKSGQPLQYWGDIARLRSLDELNSHLDGTPPDDTNRVRHQLWALSRIVARKYALVRASMCCAGLAGIVIGISGILAI